MCLSRCLSARSLSVSGAALWCTNLLSRDVREERLRFSCLFPPAFPGLTALTVRKNPRCYFSVQCRSVAAILTLIFVFFLLASRWIIALSPDIAKYYSFPKTQLIVIAAVKAQRMAIPVHLPITHTFPFPLSLSLPLPLFSPHSSFSALANVGTLKVFSPR